MSDDEVRARIAAVLGEGFELQRRDGRSLGLGEERVAFAADDEASWRRLVSEGWLLDRWRRSGIPVPRVLAEDAKRCVQVRERMHGLSGEQIHVETDHSPLFAGALPDVGARLVDAPLSPFGERVATSYGEIAARIRSATTPDEASAAGLGPTSRRTLDLDDVLARLDASNASPLAKATATRLRGWLAELPPIDAVIHGDLHFHNMCVEPDGRICGLFDLGDAGLDAAATEFLYVYSLGAQFAELALAAYGHDVNREDVARAHIRTALDHLIWHGPGTPRHDGIVAWVTAVLEAQTR